MNVCCMPASLRTVPVRVGNAPALGRPAFAAAYPKTKLAPLRRLRPACAGPDDKPSTPEKAPEAITLPEAVAAAAEAKANAPPMQQTEYTALETSNAPAWKGAKLVPTLAVVLLGLAINFLVPCPAGITSSAWTLTAIFVATVTGLVLEPLPTGAWAVLAITTCLATKALTFPQAFSAMTNEVLWLIVASFFFAKGFEKTGLGERVANIFVAAMGKSTLGLSIGLNMAEALVAPAMPSTTARAGGIFMPVIKSLSDAAGSKAGHPSRHKLGTYLTSSQFQTSASSSNLFLTAAAQNLLCLKLAAEVGAPVNNAFATWSLGACVPALIGLVATPVLLYALNPPEIKDTPKAPEQAKKRLQELGPLTRDEAIMMGTILAAVTMWVFGDAIGVAPVLAALMGLCGLLFTGVLTWKDCLAYNPAWDTLVWFSVLVSMSGQLSSQGVIKVFADAAGTALTSMDLGWPALFGLLHLLFFGLHYLFASQTAHVGALLPAFCSLMLAGGVPPMLAAMTLAYNVNLFGALTHYASGQAAVYYGAGYMELTEVFKTGGIVAAVNLLIWGVVGMGWWKVLGWY